MQTTTKRDIAERVARTTGQSQALVKEIMHCLFEEIVEALSNEERLEFRNFGVFEVVERRPRTGRNPRTGERVAVPAKHVVNFRMGKTMRERIIEQSPSAEPGLSDS